MLPMPSHLRDAAPSVTVYYITSPSIYPDVPLTSNAVLKASHTHRDADVAPGKLDIVVVPGPDPSSTYEKEGLEWLRRQAETPGVDILSVCTGILVCASAGIVDGKLASGPRGMQSDLMKKFPKIKLVGDSQRWVQDGNFWSSGESPLCLCLCLSRWRNYEVLEIVIWLTSMSRRCDQWQRLDGSVRSCLRTLAGFDC